MPLMAYISSKTSHGGVIVAAGDCRGTVEGPKIARVNIDIHQCPIHGANLITSGSQNVSITGFKVAYIGSTCGCGATIVTGATKTDLI